MGDRKFVGARLRSLLITAAVWITAMTAAPAQTIAPSAPMSAPAQNASTELRDPPPQKCDTLRTIVVGLNPPQHPPLLSVHVKSDGSMHDPVLVASSGDGDVDQAVLSCADGYHVSGVADSGIAAETTWVLGYYWRRGWSGFAPASPSGKPAESCERRLFAQPSDDKVTAKDTILSYVIGADGLAKNVAVVASSGAPDLDRQASNCVSAWRFFPVFRNGEAIAVERTFTVKWQVR
jgi:TonB family protein